jgi:hypothetical protein
MMTLIHNHMPVAGYQVCHPLPTNQALHHGNVHLAGRFQLSRADPADSLWIQAEEHRELCNPLVEDRFSVDKNKGRKPPHGDKHRADDRLAGPEAQRIRRVSCQEGVCGLL